MAAMIAIFTDGACSGNPGPGGWGAVVAGADGAVRELGGGEANTTNNRMEMTAVLEGLRAVRGRPGPGGWGCVVAAADGNVRELGGGEAGTTNNRMEMTAVLEGLRAARGLPGPAVVHTDSTYVLGGITSWISGWKRRGWTTAAGEPVKNEDLWRALDAAVAERGPGGVEWRWVRGHAGHDANERAVQLARDGVAMARLKG